MDNSIFLARVFSLYFIIVSIAMLVNAADISTLLKETVVKKSAILLSGLFTLMIGVLVVVSHNIWVANWTVVITLIGWMSLIKGTVRLFFPERVMGVVKKLLDSQYGYRVCSVIVLILGIYLGYFGFLQSW